MLDLATSHVAKLWKRNLSLEDMKLGVPGFLITVAENQYEQLDYFNRLRL